MQYDTLMTIDDLARYLKVKPRTIYEWLRHKKVPATKVIGQWRFRRERIDMWLDIDNEAPPRKRGGASS